MHGWSKSPGTGRGDGVWQAIIGGGPRHSPLAGEDTDTTYGSPVPSRCPEDTGSPYFTNPHFTNIPSTPKISHSKGGNPGGRIAPVARGSVQSCLPTSTSSTANSADQLTAIAKIEIYAMIRQIYAHVYPEHHAILTLRVGFMTLGHKNPVELYLGICRLHGIKPVPEYSGQRRAARGGLADSQTTTAHRQAPL